MLVAYVFHVDHHHLENCILDEDMVADKNRLCAKSMGYTCDILKLSYKSYLLLYLPYMWNYKGSGFALLWYDSLD